MKQNDSIPASEGNAGRNFALLMYFDQEELQQIVDSFTGATGIPVIITDPQGVALPLSPSGEPNSRKDADRPASWVEAARIMGGKDCLAILKIRFPDAQADKGKTVPVTDPKTASGMALLRVLAAQLSARAGSSRNPGPLSDTGFKNSASAEDKPPDILSGVNLSGFKPLLEDLEVGFLLQNAAAEVLLCNPMASRLLGLSLAQFLGQQPIDAEWKAINPDGTPVLVQDMPVPLSIRQKARVKNSILGIQKSQQADFCWILVNASPLLNASGDVVYVVCTFTDITERMSIEKSLRDSERKFRELFEANTDGINIFNLNPDGSFSEIIDLNENAAAMLGYSRDEMKRFNLLSMEIIKDSASLEKRKSDLLTRGFSTFETQLLHKDGHPIDVEIKVLLINFNDKPSLMNIVRDISERKRAEETLTRYAEALSLKNVEKNRLFSIIAHDLRSPFNGFLGFTRMMADNLPTMTRAEMQLIAENMSKSANMLFGLLENLLEWSGMEGGMIGYQPEELLLEPFTRESLQSEIHLAIQKTQSFELEIDNGLSLRADKNMLASILRNLTSNAVKFTPAGGNIKLSASVHSLGMAVIRVCDSGIGIPPDMESRLFRIDEKVSRKGTEGEPSTGLGLLICKGFIEKHGGRIWIEPSEGTGTCFCFTLPLSNGEAEWPAEKPAAAHSENAGKLRVLVAEDDDISRLLITKAVSKFSREVITAVNGKLAVEVMQREKDIDLILMDIKMPVMDGHEATRRIREINPGVIIIAQTAFSSPADCEDALRAGCNHYISKPIQIQMLEDIIRQYFPDSF
jgi:PAS domain S-box-containing protein